MPFDATVAAGVRAGDPDALATVYRTLVGPLTSWLRSQVGDPHLAEDLANETFLKLVRGCRQVQGEPLQIRSWLYRVAYRNLVDHRRARGRRPERLADTPPEQEEPRRGPVEWAEAGETAAHVRAALTHLSEEQAQVLTLRFVAGLSAPEVADVLDKSEGAVRALQHRGVTALAKLIREGAVPVEGSAATEPVEATADQGSRQAR